VKILEDIRDDIRGLRRDIDHTNATMAAGFEATNAAMKAGFELSNARFEVIETAIRDLAQQLVMLARGVKVAVEQRVANDERFADHERRIAELERRGGG